MARFEDNSGDALVITFDSNDGAIDFYGNGISTFEFDGDTSLKIAKFIVEKINSLTPEPLVDEVTYSAPQPVVNTGGDARSNWNLTALSAAKELGLGVEFRYSKLNTGPIEARTLAEIDSVHETEKGHTVVLGYDEDREEVRNFRLDWIKGLVQVTS